MRTNAVDPAIIQNEDTVCMLNRIDPLRNNDNRDILQGFGKSLAQPAVGRRVNGAGRIVEDDDFRVFQQCGRCRVVVFVLRTN